MNQFDDAKSFATKLSVMGHPLRISIICLVSSEEMNVSELCKLLEISQPMVSQHLRLLRAHGLVHERRVGKRVYYFCDRRLGKLLEEARNILNDELA